MNTITFILIVYYIITGLIGIGRFQGEKYNWYDRLFGFLLGFIFVPMMIGKLIQKNL